MLTIEDVKADLGEDVTYPDDLIGQAIAAETAAQASVCIIGHKRAAELDDALLRRVRATLAGAVDGRITRRLGGADPDVRRIETPFSKRVAADAESVPAKKKTSVRRRRRSTPSTTQKRKK